MTPKTDKPRVMRLADAARYLAISQRRVRGLIQRGALSLVRYEDSEDVDNSHSAWLVTQDDLDRLIERSKVNLQ